MHALHCTYSSLMNPELTHSEYSAAYRVAVIIYWGNPSIEPLITVKANYGT